MGKYSDLFRKMNRERFGAVFMSSTRAARDVYFRRLGVKAPKKRSSGLGRAKDKNAVRIGKLHEVLGEHDDEEMLEEILRTHFLGKRELLASALDHLGIEHEAGLTDSEDVKKIADMGAPELRKLVASLRERATDDDIALYLEFMDAKNVAEAMGPS